MARAKDVAVIPSPLDSPPPGVEVTADFGARSQRGSLRSVNDDHYVILRLGRHLETLLTSLPELSVSKRFEEFAYGMVVADGMGRAAEPASRLAVSTLVNLATCFGRWHLRIDEAIGDEVADRARRFYRSVNASLLEASRDHQRGFQTTMTAVFSAGTQLFFAHVGHSRAYLLRDGRLLQLTRDHTLDQRRPGELRLVDVAECVHDQQHILTRTLGGLGRGGLKIDIERVGLLHGDVVLVCTNGLTDVIDDEHIAATLRAHSTPDDRCRALVNLAVESGGTDDATALVGQYQIPAEAVSTENE
jgi:protein phosphatase